MAESNGWKKLKDVKAGSGDTIQGRWNERSLIIESRKKGGGEDWKKIDIDKLVMYRPAAQEKFRVWAKSQ